MADPQHPTALSVCSGIGMLDLAWRAVTSGRTVGYVEREAFAAAVLLDRMEEQALDPAPVWCGNLEELDPAPFLGVDWLIGGIPCPPYSSAGKRLAASDERDLVDAFVDLARELVPPFVFVENVGGFADVRGMGRLAGPLAEVGYDSRWLPLRASEVGAPHQRERMWFLAWRAPGALAHAHSGRREALRQPQLAGVECALGDEPDGRNRDPWSGAVPQPALRGTPDECPGWLDRLRALGNSVVRKQAEAALRELMRDLETPAPEGAQQRSE